MSSTPSTPAGRLAVIQQIYQDALNSEPHDLSQATTAVQVAAVLQNVASARSAYFTAAADALNNTGTGVEAAFVAAQNALTAVQKARDTAADIATLLQKLNSATTAGTSLLSAAKSV